MTHKKIIFYKLDEQALSFDNVINEASENDALFSLLLSKGDYYDYSLSFDDEESRYNLKGTFQFQVNISKVGSFHFLIKHDSFDKQEAVMEIIRLKEIEVTDLESAKNKVNALFDFVKKYDILFSIYTPKGEYSLSIDQLDYNLFMFFIKVSEKPVIEEKEAVSCASNEDKSFLGILKMVFSPLAKDYIHYIFVIVAGFLISFTTGVGVFNVYKNNAISIFFFGCAVVGLVLSGFIFVDFFKKSKFKSFAFVWSVIVSLIGIAIGAAGFMIFFSTQKELPENLASPKNIIIIQCLTAFIATALAVVAGYFISLRKQSSDDEEE